jgi:hypothetical protein
MKSVVTPAVLALLLFAAGAVCRALGGAQERIAHAGAQLATMEFAAAADAGEPDRSPSSVARLPILGAAMVSDADAARGTAAYWLRRYEDLKLTRDAGGALVERDPRLLLLGANAAYRAARIDPADRSAAVERLQIVVQTYADVLKSGGPEDAMRDAAYNYELTARMRSALEAPPAKVAAPAAPAAGERAAIHGTIGGTPKAVPSKSFKVVVPKRGDERENNPEAGQGQQKVRRG